MSPFFVYQSMQKKLPVAVSLYAKVCKRNCRWPFLCILKDLFGAYNTNKERIEAKA